LSERRGDLEHKGRKAKEEERGITFLKYRKYIALDRNNMFDNLK